MTTATIATTPANTNPTTFRSISVFALPSLIHNNQPLLKVSYSETSAAALCGTTGSSPTKSWISGGGFPPTNPVRLGAMSWSTHKNHEPFLVLKDEKCCSWILDPILLCYIPEPPPKNMEKPTRLGGNQHEQGYDELWSHGITHWRRNTEPRMHETMGDQYYKSVVYRNKFGLQRWVKTSGSNLHLQGSLVFTKCEKNFDPNLNEGCCKVGNYRWKPSIYPHAGLESWNFPNDIYIYISKSLLWCAYATVHTYKGEQHVRANTYAPILCYPWHTSMARVCSTTIGWDELKKTES